MRGVARRFGRNVYCHRALVDAEPVPGVRMKQAVQRLADNKRRALMSWLTRGGPFWDDLRRHDANDWLECRGEIVTDTAVGETASRTLRGVECALISATLDAAPAPPRPVAGGEHGRQVRDPERPRLSSTPIAGGPPVTGQHPGGALAGGSGLPGQLRAETRRGDRHRRARRGAPGIVQLGEVGRQGHVVELAPVEPGVEAAERAGVRPSGVRADGGLDQPARGLSRSADCGLFGVGPGGRIIHVKGNYR